MRRSPQPTLGRFRAVTRAAATLSALVLLGGGLAREKVENVPVLRALSNVGIGDAADLEVDAWLRCWPAC